MFTASINVVQSVAGIRNKYSVEELTRQMKDQGYEVDFGLQMSLIGCRKYAQDTDYLTLKQYEPAMFLPNMREQFGPEYLAQRVTQLAAMLREEIDPLYWELQEASGSDAPCWAPCLTINIHDKWMTVEIRELDHQHTLCWVYWSDEDLGKARAELREELGYVKAWFERLARRQ